METFSYTAVNRDGQPVAGDIDAATRGDAIGALAAKGIFVTQLGEPNSDAPETAAPSAPLRRGRRRVSSRARAGLLRQLATALQAGLPLLPALRAVQEQTDPSALRDLIEDLADRVQAGESLSEAMAAHQRDFRTLEVSMVRVGETAGMLDEVMGHLSDFAERDVDIRQKIRSAAAYPAFVLGLAVVSVVIIITWIIPTVMSSVMEGMSTAALPWPTRVLMAVSDFLRSFWWVLGLAIVAGVLGFRAWLRTPDGRFAFDRFQLRIPVLRTAIRRVAVARFARTLGTLNASGIEILEALHVLRDTLGNEALARKIDTVATDIRQGQSIAEPLRQTGEFPSLLVQVTAMGEKTGKLDQLLLQTAEAYEKETAAAIARALSILPAVFIVLLAVVVAFILAAVLLPIIEMQTGIPGA